MKFALNSQVLVMAATSGMVLAAGPAAANGSQHGGWGPSVAETDINSAQSDGCPIESFDGLSLYIASTRPNGFGDLDIWVADRDSIDSPWDAPQNLGMPINSGVADFCPDPEFGRWLFFVSARDPEESCGGGDIFLSRQSPANGYSEPMRLLCAPLGPNTAGTERSPTIIETKWGTYLMYSTNGGQGDDDIYISKLGHDGQFGPGHVVKSLSSDYSDQMPTVREAGHGLYEVSFNSDRPTGGRHDKTANDNQDIYISTSHHPAHAWKVPRNAGPNVNTTGNETRATISYDGKRLHFGRDGDVFVSERKHGY